ncbi:MAG TPA: tetratricopeptide repeat protein, partial [Stellaceae bacterium]|nr:tetratricopeptide repeat protein [Stellaceae bacterium]
PTGAFVSEIFREIDEELRRDNLLKLWSRYGRHIVVLVVLVLVAAGSIVAWRDHQRSERRAQSMRYSSALSLVRDGKAAEAAKVFAVIAPEGGGYATLASFEEAELLAKSGDRKGAAAAYDRIAETGGLDPVFRQLATLLSVMQGLPDTDPHSVIDRLAPMTSPGNPWRSTALELTAAARLQAGDKSGALEVYKTLADDLGAPQGTRARAAEMAAALAS